LLVLYPVMHWSPEDNLSECAYEAEKLLLHMRAENTSDKVKKRSNLVYVCMTARRFEFDFDAYERVASKNRLPGEEDDARKETFIATAASFWRHDWSRYWPF
jgi:hypothetical protein